VFVALSKTLDVAVSPLSWALALLALALLLRRRGGIPAALTLLALAVLYAGSTSAVANALTASVERSAVSTARPSLVYDAVIVLSGGVDEALSRATGRLELNAAGDRVVAGFELLREGRARAILLSGGPVRPVVGARTEPELLASALVAWGIAPGRVVLETASRNTHENAVESARVAAARGWRSLLLVTSAAHMQRALGCFHKAGLAPDALPVDWRGERDLDEDWLPRARSLRATEDALRELTGRVVYRLMGYT
jgi:uncharacterized SAM-binding protein YcdF (DUF218 family)